jgi:hypothetical protein
MPSSTGAYPISDGTDAVRPRHNAVRMTGGALLLALALFSWVMIGIFVAFLAGILLLGVYSPRSGADVLDWRPTRSPEAESQNEVDDIAQMLEASNALRRRRGVAERTEDDVAGAVHDDQRELDRRARDYRRPSAERASPDGETDHRR